MMTASGELHFDVDGENGTIRVVISAAVLKTFAGRSHITVSEVLDIYRLQLEEAARAKARRSLNKRQIRLEAPDL